MKRFPFTHSKTLLPVLCAALLPLAYSGEQAVTFNSRSIDLDVYGIRDPSKVRAGSLTVTVGRPDKPVRIHLDADPVRKARPGIEPEESRAPSFHGNCFIAAELDTGLLNNLDAYFNTYYRTPSFASLGYFPDPAGFRCLGLNYEVNSEGYCGMWMHLFNRELGEQARYFLDAGAFSCLVVWIRGEQGGERVLVKVSDKNTRERQVSLEIGELRDFLPSGEISREWQAAVLPLDVFPGEVRVDALASLTFQAVSGRGTVYMSRLGFCRDQSLPPPLPGPAGRPSDRRKLENATWVWKTSSIIDSRDRIRELLDFVDVQGLSLMFLQIPWNSEDSASEMSGKADRLRTLISALSGKGIQVYALDGHRDYTLREKHDQVLDTMSGVIRYNQLSEPGERFHGFHLDIEPYLVPGFRGGKQRSILQQYVEIHQKAAEKAHRANLKIGASLPFWFDGGREDTQAARSLVLRGSRKDVLEHMIELMDHIAIMSYRTSAFGPSGTAAVCERELELAGKYGKPVYIGLETSRIPDEEQYEFSGPPQTRLPETSSGRAFFFILREDSEYRGYFVPARDLAAFQKRLASLHVEPESFLFWKLGRPTRTEGNWISFFGLGVRRLFSVLGQTRDALSGHSSFAGFALHSYSGYQALLGSEPLSLKKF